MPRFYEQINKVLKHFGTLNTLTLRSGANTHKPSKSFSKNVCCKCHNNNAAVNVKILAFTWF